VTTITASRERAARLQRHKIKEQIMTTQHQAQRLKIILNSRGWKDVFRI